MLKLIMQNLECQAKDLVLIKGKKQSFGSYCLLLLFNVIRVLL